MIYTSGRFLCSIYTFFELLSNEIKISNSPAYATHISVVAGGSCVTPPNVSVPVVSIIVTSLVSAGEEVQHGMESETVTLWFYQILTNARLSPWRASELSVSSSEMVCGLVVKLE